MPTTPATVLAALHWRYATKKFDAAARVDPEKWAALRHSLVLAPSSYGLQPWRFLEVRDPAVRARLREASWGQTQVTDAAHFLVFTARTSVTPEEIDRFIAATAATRGVPREALADYQGMIEGDILKGPRAAWIPEWTARQAYLALGQVMTAAALLGVDTCPMEGLDPAAYDRILGLEGGGYRTLCALAVGHRSAEDGYAGARKVRHPESEVIRAV